MIYYNQRMVDVVDSKVIDKRLLFYGFENFFKRRLIIKALLPTKSVEERIIYRYYLYSQPFINDTLKNYMWDYLNNYMDEASFMLIHRNYSKRKDT